MNLFNIASRIAGIRSKEAKFNINEFKTLRSYQEILNYIYNDGKPRLELVGEGSGRVVFLFKNNEVLKVAKTDLGKSQNAKEKECFSDINMRPVLAEIKEQDPRSNWLRSEYVTGLKSWNEINKVAGFDLKDFLMGLEGKKRELTGYETLVRENLLTSEDESQYESLKEKFPDIQETDPASVKRLKSSVSELVKKADLTIDDLLKPLHWGLNSSGVLKLRDYGLDTGDFWRLFREQVSNTPDQKGK